MSVLLRLVTSASCLQPKERSLEEFLGERAVVGATHSFQFSSQATFLFLQSTNFCLTALNNGPTGMSVLLLWYYPSRFHPFH
jgi:hypothetical protein